VEVVQLLDKNRPAANSMFFDFYIKLAAKEFAFKSNQKDYYYYQSRFSKKIYKHFGYTINSPAQVIDWIEDLLKRRIADCRQQTTDLVLAPYLVNIKKYEYEAAYNTRVQWLDKCSQRSSLEFNVRYEVRYALNRAKREAMRPMKLDTMRSNYPDMYQEIMIFDTVMGGKK
jgi:Primase X